MKEYNIWQTATRSSLEYIINEILRDVEYVISGGFAVQIYSYELKDKSFKRKTKDIDILILKEDKDKILDLLNTKKLYYKTYRSAIRDSLDIFIDNSPKFSISFVDELPEYAKIKINGKTEVNVESLESLLVNKFSTYLFRTEEKDLLDINQIIKILKQKGLNIDKVISAMKKYNIVEDAEKIFFIFIEYNGLIESANRYIDISDEERDKILRYLKAKKLIFK